MLECFLCCFAILQAFSQLFKLKCSIWGQTDCSSVRLKIIFWLFHSQNSLNNISGLTWKKYYDWRRCFLLLMTFFFFNLKICYLRSNRFNLPYLKICRNFLFLNKEIGRCESGLSWTLDLIISDQFCCWVRWQAHCKYKIFCVILMISMHKSVCMCISIIFVCLGM